MEKIKIIIVDDHEIFRKGLKYVLNQYDNFEIVAEAENGEEFLSLIERQSVDIVLLDIEMPVMNGIDASKIAIKNHPDIKIIVLSSYGEEEYISTMILLGVKGFVLKKAGIHELEEAIISVNNGKNYFSQDLLKKMVFSKIKTTSYTNKPNIKLTKRELEVLDLISKGFSNIQIGKKLFISPMTVNNHRAHLLEKMNASNTASLIMQAIKYGFLKV